jgi:hypothetical protein
VIRLVLVVFALGVALAALTSIPSQMIPSTKEEPDESRTNLRLAWSGLVLALVGWVPLGVGSVLAVARGRYLLRQPPASLSRASRRVAQTTVGLGLLGAIFLPIYFTIAEVVTCSRHADRGPIATGAWGILVFGVTFGALPGLTAALVWTRRKRHLPVAVSAGATLLVFVAGLATLWWLLIVGLVSADTCY